jgi:hypothetical protein
MPGVQIKPREAQLRHMRKLLGKDMPQYMDKSLVAAVNDTTKQLRTRISSKIRDRVGIKKKDIDQHIKATRATATPEATVTLDESERLPLKYFGARQTRAGVAYRISKTAGRKVVPDAFGPAGGKRPGVAKLGFHVYRRTGTARLPIIKLYGPSPWGVFKEADLERETASEGATLLENNVRRRLNLMQLRLEGKV